MVEPISIFVSPDSQSQGKVASIVTRDGTIHTVRCKDDDELRKKLETKFSGMSVPSLINVSSEKEGRRLAAMAANSDRARRPYKVVRLVGDALIAPVRLVMYAALAALSALWTAGLLATRFCMPERICCISIKRIEKSKDFFTEATRDVRIALLRMVPGIGDLLASQYQMVRNYHEFVGSPELGESFTGFSLGPTQALYGLRSSELFTPWSLYDMGERFVLNGNDTIAYANMAAPTIADASAQVDANLTTWEPALVRIPSGHGRYHDAFFIPSTKPSPSKEDKTIVIYHGNNESPMNCTSRAQAYCEKGYNVLISSYAGDLALHGNGTSHIYAPTACTESAMREDAQADVHFLKALGVTNVAVDGYSLGGAQAMNFAQAVGQEPSLTMDAVVLDRTFTSAADVVMRTAHNAVPSRALSRLAYRWAEKAMEREDPEGARQGCDGLNNYKKLEEVSGRPNFSQTKFCIIGADQDQFMADLRGRKQKGRHAAELLREAITAVPEVRVLYRIFEGTHESLPDGRVASMNFLFPEETA